MPWIEPSRWFPSADLKDSTSFLHGFEAYRSSGGRSRWWPRRRRPNLSSWLDLNWISCSMVSRGRPDLLDAGSIHRFWFNLVVLSMYTMWCSLCKHGSIWADNELLMPARWPASRPCFRYDDFSLTSNSSEKFDRYDDILAKTSYATHGLVPKQGTTG